MDASRMVRVATTGDGFEARVIAARLGAEGIVWELQGNVDGPYPLGAVHVLVEAGEADAARELLETALEPLDDDEPTAPPRRWLPAVAVALVVLMGFARIVAQL